MSTYLASEPLDMPKREFYENNGIKARLDSPSGVRNAIFAGCFRALGHPGPKAESSKYRIVTSYLNFLIRRRKMGFLSFQALLPEVEI